MKWALLFIYMISTTGLLFITFSGWGNDDPYITYRYAQNLASGQGFVYNLGERVLSTTTPLFTLLLAGVISTWNKIPGSTVPLLGNLIGAFSLALGGLFLWLLAAPSATDEDQKENAIRWVGLTGLLLYPTFPLLVSTLGSEMPLYVALCLGALVFYSRQNLIPAAVLTAMAVLTRPDGLLLAGLFLFDYWFQPKRRLSPWLPGLVFAALTLPWFLFAWGYFGTPLPATLMVKQQQGLMTISQRFAPGMITILRPYLREWFFWIEVLLVVSGLIWSNLTGSFKVWRLLFMWTVLFFGAYTLLGVSRYFWYYAPLVPGFITLVGLGIAGSSHYFSRRSTGHQIRWSQNKFWQVWLPAGLIALLAVGQIAQLNNLRTKPDSRLVVYRAVGEWLKENTPANARIGALETGIVGYYSQRIMIDFAGLIQPVVAARFNPDTDYGESAMWAVTHYLPGWLVLQEGLFPELETSYVSDHCDLARKFQGESFGYTYNMMIYRCLE